MLPALFTCSINFIRVELVKLLTNYFPIDIGVLLDLDNSNQ